MSDRGGDGTFHVRPLLVLALGGNALSPPVRSVEDYTVEREIVAQTGALLNRLIGRGYRLLIVHGNGPQVGRLLRQDPTHGNLDIHIAQTQGELGYLLSDVINEPTVCLLTRVIVAAEPGRPVKPVGPVLDERPTQGAATRTGSGWRLTVPSPRPLQVVELPAIQDLIAEQHVIAGGGGGVPRSPSGSPVMGVVDKDWVASLLAVALKAERLVFATDVAGVYENPDQETGEPITHLTPSDARALIRSGAATPGSMAPKLESAIEFTESTRRSALICALEHIEAALAGTAGTAVG